MLEAATIIFLESRFSLDGKHESGTFQDCCHLLKPKYGTPRTERPMVSNGWTSRPLRAVGPQDPLGPKTLEAEDLFQKKCTVHHMVSTERPYSTEDAHKIGHPTVLGPQWYKEKTYNALGPGPASSGPTGPERADSPRTRHFIADHQRGPGKCRRCFAACLAVSWEGPTKTDQGDPRIRLRGLDPWCASSDASPDARVRTSTVGRGRTRIL